MDVAAAEPRRGSPEKRCSENHRLLGYFDRATLQNTTAQVGNLVAAGTFLLAVVPERAALRAVQSY